MNPILAYSLLLSGTFLDFIKFVKISPEMNIAALLNDFSDRFEHLAHNTNITIMLCGQTVSGLFNTYWEGRRGELAAFIDNYGNLAVCVVKGSAHKKLNSHVRDKVLVSVSIDEPAS